MTGQSHFDKLLEGPESWNEWRHQHPAEIPQLTGSTLPLSRREFTTADGKGINLKSARLLGADLRFSSLANADLSNASLQGADLSGACLRGAIFDGSDLTDVSFGTADLEGATFDGAILDGARMSQAQHLTGGQIAAVLSARGTILPDGIAAPPGETDGAVDDAAPPPPPAGQVQPDLYALLGLSPAATAEEIQTAYRAIAKTLHPDRAMGGRSSDDAFKCATATAEILLDSRKRRQYDRRELDAHGNRLPEAIAGEARTRRHGAFVAAFVLGMLMLPAVYLAMTLTRSQPQHVVSVIPEPVPAMRELTAETGSDGPFSREPAPTMDSTPAPVTAAMTPDTSPVQAVPGPDQQNETAVANREPDQTAPAAVPAAPETPAASNPDTPAPANPETATLETGAAHPVPATLTAQEEEQLLSKGVALMQAGNIVSARAFFTLLAERGSAKGAFALGQSFDPAVLADLPLQGGPEPDPAMALHWYEEAVRLAQ